MTKEQLIKLIWKAHNAVTWTVEIEAEKILAALEKEREGEVVLGEGEVYQLGGCTWVGENPSQRLINKVLGKKGRLVFVPEGEK